MEPRPLRSSRQVAEAVLQDASVRERLTAYAATRFGIERIDAEDLLQETAFELLRHENQVRRPEAFVFFVFRTRCAHLIRGSDARRRAVSRLREEMEAPGLTEMPDLDVRIALREGLARLSPKCRRLLAAHYRDGTSLRDAARLVGLSRASMGKTISRCLQRLRRSLA